VRSREPRGHRRHSRGSAWLGAFLVSAIVLSAPTAASAASSVLEYEVPAGPPVTFTVEGGELTAEMEGVGSLVHCDASHGKGEITGPRATVSEYRFTGCTTERDSHANCESAGEPEGEITTGQIEAELVWVSQAKHEVGELLDPSGRAYIKFECEGIAAVGYGPFLAPVTPIDSEATSFTATLNKSASMQIPDEYEGSDGEVIPAIPTARHGTDPDLLTTGVESSFGVHSSVPVDIEAVTAQEVEAQQRAVQEAWQRAQKQREEAEARQREQKQDEEAAVLASAAAKKRQEEAAAKRQHEEELASAKLTVLTAKVVGHKLVLSLRLSKPGVVSVRGSSLKRTSKTLAAGVRRLTVSILASAYSAHRHTARVTVMLHTASRTVSRTVTIRL
jgi:hypothetical protein